MSTEITVSAIQQPCNLGLANNQNLLIESVHQAAQQNCDLIVFPELHNGIYFCQQENTENFDLAEPIPGPTTKKFSALAERLKIIIVLSLFEKRAPGLYHNTAVVLDKNGKIAGKYRKMHIPDDPGFYEKFYFTPGDLGFNPIQTSIGKLGVLVCWDQWYPEAARLMALSGADILIYPTAIGWDPSDDAGEKQRQLDSWVTIQRSHAVANGLPLISCNRTGFEADPLNANSGIQFWGNSFITGPQGEMLESADNSEIRLLIQKILYDRSENTRRIWPFLRDRRIEFYSNLTKRYID